MVEAGKATRFKKGQVTWSKLNKGKYSTSRKGTTLPQWWKDKLSSAKKGKAIPHLHNAEVRKKIGDAQRGDKHWNWKGDVVSEADKIRRSKEGKAFKLAVKLRDSYKCVLCGSNERLQVDHIKPFSTNPELRFAIDNGRTLCEPCHLLTPTYGGRTTFANHKKIYGGI